MDNKKAIEELNKLIPNNPDYNDKIIALTKAIKSLETLEQEPKRGHWIPRTYIGRGTIQMYVCSNCRQEFGYDAETGIEFVDYNYCPNCGANMRGE